MKVLRILTIIAITALAGWIGYQAYLFLGRGTVIITVDPKEAPVVIDGKTYSADNTSDIRLSPGEHTILIGPDGFKPVNQTITMGWQEEQNLTFKLQPKEFKDIYQNLSPDITFTNYEAIQTKFFLDDTWAAGYIVPNQEGRDIAIAVLKRTNGAWSLAVFGDELPDNVRQLVPPVVYDYIKEFGE